MLRHQGKCIFRRAYDQVRYLWEKQHGLINGIINRFGIKRNMA